MPDPDEFEPLYELTAEDRAALAEEAHENAPVALTPPRPFKKHYPRVKFYDAYMCWKNGEWEFLNEEQRRHYVMILRRSAGVGSFSNDETKRLAKETLEAMGLPLESEKDQRAKRGKQVLSEQQLANLEKSRRKLVDRQKRLLAQKLAAAVDTRMAVVVEPGPYQQQAIDELVAEGGAVLVADDMVPITVGRVPADGSPRRSRRVVRVGCVLPVEADEAPPAATDDEDLI